MMGIVDHGLVSLDEVFMRTYTQQGAGFGKGPIGGSIMSLCAEGDHIWIGTYYGLFSYDPAANQFIAYNQQDGALPNEYIRTSSLLTDKHLYMGGVKGMVQIAYNHAVPEKDAPSFDIAECTLDERLVHHGHYPLDPLDRWRHCVVCLLPKAATAETGAGPKQAAHQRGED